MLTEPYVLGDAPPSLAPFSFDAKPLLCTPFRFSFPWRANGAAVSLKRQRSIADVDGEGSSCTQKKKRRLRLDLITSRLSQPFATPTTYIAGRGSVKGPKQLRPKAAGRSLMRRAAIINWMRRRKVQSNEPSLASTEKRLMEDRSRYVDQGLERMEDDSNLRRHFKIPEHNADHLPHTPSPLGLSNYDAIDLEGDPYDDEDWDEPRDDLVNSDFKKRDPVDALVLEIDGYPSLHYHPDSPHPRAEPLAKDLMELVTDGEKQQEVSYAQF